MLAQNFKTAKELGCTEDELRAAITVLGMMERGELVESPVLVNEKVKNGFNMRVWWLQAAFRSGSCGTVGCLGGWIESISGHVMGFPTLETWEDLFHPWGWGTGDFSVERCARALRAKLTTGKADWS